MEHRLFLILLALAALMMVGCVKTNDKGEIIVDNCGNQSDIDNPYIQMLDSCEYICWHSRMAHKGNCKFCEKRRQKEMKELLNKLKEK